MNNFNEYLNFSTEEDKEKQLRIMDKIHLSNETTQKIKNIKKDIKLLVFAEPYCPDCKAFVPFIQKFSELNPHILVTYISRSENEEFLASLSEEMRIPSMFYYINDSLHITYLEVPKFVLERAKNGEDEGELRYNYRTGVYNHELEEELLNIILEINNILPE